MTAPDISQFELADPAPAGQLIPAPAAARTAAGQSLSGLSAGRRPEFDVMRGFVVAGLVVFHSAVAFASGASWFVTDPRPRRGFTVISLALWPLIIIFSPAILLAGEPVNRGVMRRVRRSASTAQLAVVRHRGWSARAAAVRLPVRTPRCS